MISRFARSFVTAVLLGALVTACSQPPPSDGVGSITVIEPDGTYTGSTCADVGGEFGRQLNDQVLVIIEANRTTPGNASDPISTAVIRLAQGANDRLRALDIADECDVPEFLSAADQAMSDELRSSVGDFATTPVVTWDVWHDYVRDQLTIIDPEA